MDFKDVLKMAFFPGGLVGGAIASGSKGGMFGKPEEFGQTQLYNPQQQSAMGSLLNQGMANSNFDTIEQNAREKFKSDTIPSIAERFTSMGGGQRSSAFSGALGQAGVGLETGLAGLRSQYGMQQLGMGLGRQFEPYHRQAQPGALQTSVSSLMQLLPLLAFL